MSHDYWCADCYVLVNSRDPSIAYRVLKKFASNATETCNEYHFPYLSDAPATIFPDAASLMDFMETARDQEYAIYWQNNDPQSRTSGVSVHYTVDNAMILSVHCSGSDAPELLTRLLDVAGSSCGYFTLESPPPITVAEFQAIARSSRS